VNPIDWKLRQGALKMVTGRSFPRAMGSDFVGLVHSVGPGVTQFKPGDHVFRIARLKESGAFAEAIVTKESFLAPRPAELPAFPRPQSWRGMGSSSGPACRPASASSSAAASGGIGEAVVQVARMLGGAVSPAAAAPRRCPEPASWVDAVYDYATVNGSELPGLRGGFDVVFATSGALPVKTAMQMPNKTGAFLDINATSAKFLHCALVRRHKVFNCAPTTQILTDVAHAAVNGELRMSIGETMPFGYGYETNRRARARPQDCGRGAHPLRHRPLT
jgi:NADPH:quinone reductase-like Zn-dependent oxidoreductase